MHDRLNTPVRVGCPESAVYGSGDHFDKGWGSLRGRKLLLYKSMPDPFQKGPDAAIPCADLTAGSLVVRGTASASGKNIFEAFPAISLVWHQEVRKFRMEPLAVLTAEAAKAKDEGSVGSSVYFPRFPIVCSEVSAANRASQMLRPRNNKNSLSHFCVKLVTISTLQ